MFPTVWWVNGTFSRVSDGCKSDSSNPRVMLSLILVEEILEKESVHLLCLTGVRLVRSSRTKYKKKKKISWIADKNKIREFGAAYHGCKSLILIFFHFHFIYFCICFWEYSNLDIFPASHLVSHPIHNNISIPVSYHVVTYNLIFLPYTTLLCRLYSLPITQIICQSLSLSISFFHLYLLIL